MVYLRVPETVERSVDLTRRFYPVCVPCQKGFVCMTEETWHMVTESLNRLDDDLFNAEPELSWKFISETGSIFADVFLVTEPGLVFIANLDLFLRVLDNFALSCVIIPLDRDMVSCIEHAYEDDKTKVDIIPDHFVCLEEYL